MKRFVLDASVALRWFLDRSIPPYATRVKQLLMNGAQALVPALWHLEMANALAIAGRRQVLHTAEVDRALRDIEQLLILGIDTDSSLVSVRQACTSARSFQLSAYDATYLTLAARDGLPLATLDDALRTAARHAGVEIV